MSAVMRVAAPASIASPAACLHQSSKMDFKTFKIRRKNISKTNFLNNAKLEKTLSAK